MRRVGVAAAIVTVVLVAITGCTVTSGSGPSKENSVSAQVDKTHRFEIDLSGPMPTRDQVGIGPGQTRIGYVDVSVGVFISDNAYILWDLSWDPPIPGYTYGADGVPRPSQAHSDASASTGQVARSALDDEHGEGGGARWRPR